MMMAEGEMESDCSSGLRLRVVEFLILSAHELEVSPIVKYTALSFFADRFYRSLSRCERNDDTRNWLLQPIRESNLQLFALISLWISSKVHNSPSLSVKSLKSFGDKMIKEQHFATRDFLEAEVIFMQVLGFDIGTANVAFAFLEQLFVQFKRVAKVGELVNLEACMEIMDLLYEKEETSTLFCSPSSLAASILECLFKNFFVIFCFFNCYIFFINFESIMQKISTACRLLHISYVFLSKSLNFPFFLGLTL